MPVTTADKYLEELRKQTESFTAKNSSTQNSVFNSKSTIQDNSPTNYNAVPNQGVGYANPNEHITAQQGLLTGAAAQSPTDRKNITGLNERDLMTAQAGDIASAISKNALERRRTEMERLLASYGNGSDLNGLGDPDAYLNGFGSGGGNDQDQLSNARLIAQIAKQRGLGDDAILIAIMTGLAESELKNISHGDRDSVGIFQQRTSQGWGSIDQIMNPNYSIGKFFDGLQGVNYKGMQPWQAAQAVQRSFDASGSNYQARMGAAQSIMAQLRSNPTGVYAASSGSSNIQSNPGLNNWINSHNNRYLDYDNAYGAQCVDLYAFYTSGFVGGNPLPVGYAPEILRNYDTRVYAAFSANSPIRPGDVAVWNPGAHVPVGHVAIVVGDNGNGMLRVLQSNATAAGSAGNSIISNISKAALGGVLRPKKLM